MVEEIGLPRVSSVAMIPHRFRIPLAACLVAWPASLAIAENGFGLGTWGGNSVSVGRNTFYANGLVAQQVGRTSYFNNGLVGQRFGNLTLYNNGLVAGQGRRNTYFSNLAVGVPVQQQAGGRPGIMVYGGGYPYPLGPGPRPFGPPAGPPMGPPPGSPAARGGATVGGAAPATPWSTTPWSRTPWAR
jgi:hypothetical protein